MEANIASNVSFSLFFLGESIYMYVTLDPSHYWVSVVFIFLPFFPISSIWIISINLNSFYFILLLSLSCNFFISCNLFLCVCVLLLFYKSSFKTLCLIFTVLIKLKFASKNHIAWFCFLNAVWKYTFLSESLPPLAFNGLQIIVNFRFRIPLDLLPFYSHCCTMFLTYFNLNWCIIHKW